MNRTICCGAPTPGRIDDDGENSAAHVCWWVLVCSSVGAGPAPGGDAAEVVAPAAAAVGVGAAEHHGQPDRESAAKKGFPTVSHSTERMASFLLRPAIASLI